MSGSKKIIVAISGASGAIYGIRALEALKESEYETHVVVSKAAQITIKEETEHDIKYVQDLADFYYQPNDIAATISSGSFKTAGMIIAPCTVKTLAEIANGISNGLISRAADVILKERRKLVLMVRETPFHSVHLNNMLTLSNMGAIIAPPLPAFYPCPTTVDEIVNHSVGRVLDLFDIESELVSRWKGVKNS